MKKLTIMLMMLYTVAALTSCRAANEVPETTTAQQTPAPTDFAETAAPPSTPLSSQIKDMQSIDILYKQVSIDDGILTMDLPASFVETPNSFGHVYTAEGYASLVGDGNQFTFDVLRFYQPEDIMTSIDMLLDFDESMETYRYSSDITYRNLIKNLYFDDAVGHVSKIEIEDDEKYTATLYVENTYYKIILYSKGDFAADELALRIMTSISIDGEQAQQKAQDFTLLLENNSYTSQRLEGASVHCPDNWSPAESMYFALNNSILSMMSDTMEATATVRYYNKSDFPDIQSYDDFNDYMMDDLIERGFLSADKLGEISTFDTEHRSYVLYPSDVIFIHYNIEYEDAYYCIELIYTGVDTNVVAQLMDIGNSFAGIGEEIKN